MSAAGQLTYTLELELSATGDVIFTRPGDVEEIVWRRFKAHWGTEILAEYHGGFVISASTFLAGKEWLRAGWTALGNEYGARPSQDVIDLVQHEKSVVDLWKRSCGDELKAEKVSLVDLGLRRDLTNFQERDLSNLLAMKAGANFSVPGAGKTTVTLSLWARLRRDGLVNKLAVIAPKSAFEAWTEIEPAEVFADPPVTYVFKGKNIPTNIELLVCNYEQLEDERKVLRLADWIAKGDAMVVLDEAHRVKGGGATVRWRGCKKLTSVAARVDLLTGTPMPQSFRDLSNLFSLSWPNLSPRMLAPERLSGLSTGSVFVRTTKNELGLRKPDIKYVPIDMGEKQTQIYSALRNSYSGVFQMPSSQGSFFSAKGRAVMTLIGAATNPALLMGFRNELDFKGLTWPPIEADLDTSLLGIVENYLAHEVPPKYLWVRRYCENAAREGRKVLIWTNFVGNLRHLQKILKPLNPALIYGGVDSLEREQELNKFRTSSSCNVLLTNPQTLGEGISLHKVCHECIFVDRLYNAGLYLQAVDRIHRLGLSPEQETKVFILQSNSSVDLRVGYRLDAKITRMSEALNDESLVTSSIPEHFEVTPEELVGMDDLDADDLFKHLMNVS